MGIITFDGVDSLDFGLVVEKEPDFYYPAREYETVHVPGRSGDLIRDLGSFGNVERKYDVALAAPYQSDRLNQMITGLMAWLHSGSGYRKLTDSYDPKHYRMAYFKSSDYIENILGEAGKGTLEFECKPQRFLVDGDNPIEINYVADTGTTWSKPEVIQNGTSFIAKPLIKVTGTGSITIVFSKGENLSTQTTLSITLTSINGHMYFDMETEECYKITSGSKVYATSSWTINSGTGIAPGYSYIRFQPASGSSITKIEITPRWWEL